MNELFLKIVNMSISASWLVLAVLILRLVLKKAPKWISVLLWGIVAVRLICPFSIESALSLIPSAETIPLNIGMDTTPAINSGINAINNAVNPIISQSNTPMAGASINPLQITIGIYEYTWILGMIALAVYTAISYWRLHHKVDTAIRYQGNIFQSENVESPFVLGIIKPRIYLPFNMNEQDLEHVVAHEQAHIRRKDHWWKPLGFLLLTIHWFNPLMWIAYVLLCRDIELACDEKVIKELGNEQRADYTQALVACSVNRRMIAACPLAFGEVGVKDRVKSVLNYKKPSYWIMVTALIVCVVAAVCFLTDPKQTNSPQNLSEENYGIFISTENVTRSGLTLVVHNPLLPPGSISTGRYFAVQTYEDGKWKDLETKTEAAFPTDAFIPKKNTWSTDVNWEWLYGQLPDGKYRISKDISVSINSIGVSTNEHIEKDLEVWAEFEIQNDDIQVIEEVLGVEKAFEMNLAGNMSLQNNMILSDEYPYWCIYISNEGSNDITVEVNGNVYEVRAGNSEQIISEDAWKAGTYAVSFASIHGMYGKAICKVSTNPFTQDDAGYDVKINYGTSVIYTQQEMDSAIKLIKNEFATWEGCELHEISYISDEKCNTLENIEWMNELSTANGGNGDFTQCIMFESSFHSPKTNSGAFNPDEEYTDWQWWLARSEADNWQLMTWGY